MIMSNLQYNFSTGINPNLFAGLSTNNLTLGDELLRSSMASPVNLSAASSPMNYDTLSGYLQGNQGGQVSGLNMPWTQNLDSFGTSYLDAIKSNAPKGIPLTDKINAGAGLLTAGVGAFNAYNANKLGRRQLAFEQDAFNKNYAAQKNATNAQLEDRQRVRVQAHPELNMGVAEYMAKYGVK